MPKELIKKLKRIQKELEEMRDNANEEDFVNNFYYVDFQNGLSVATSGIENIMANAVV